MRTKTRLTLWLGTLFLLVLVLAAVALGTIWKLSTGWKDVLKANYNSIEYARLMMAALDEPEHAAVNVFAENLELQRANVTEANEQELTDSLAAHFWIFRAQPDGKGIHQVLRRDLYELIDINQKAIVRKTHAAEESADNAVMWISIVGTVCFLIAFTLFLSLPEFIAEPIRKLTEGIDRIAEGHYRERVELAGGGEFAHMADRFNAMAAELEKWEDSNLASVLAQKARAEAVINSLQDASIGVDDQGRVLFVNQQALDLLGLQDADPTGKPVTELAQRNDLLHRILQDRSGAPFKAVLGGKENYFVSGSLPILGAEGAVGTLITARNITPFQERDEAKTNFLATISHELKTPLASTDIGLTLLERKGVTTLDADQLAVLGDLRKDHQRLVRIVGELLDLAQAESGTIQMRLTEFPLEQVVRNALEAMKVKAKEKDILFAVRTGPNDAQVRADADKAVWVLVNILSNAVRHSPPRSVVTIETSLAEGQVSLSITDQGPGISAAEQEHLFERFAPGASTRNGTGLGLSIAREFMESMGGGIALDKENTNGAIFILTFAAAR